MTQDSALTMITRVAIRRRYGPGTSRKTGAIFVALRAASQTVIFGRSHEKSAKCAQNDGAEADGATDERISWFSYPILIPFWGSVFDASAL
jgi:hypothetical protein